MSDLTVTDQELSAEDEEDVNHRWQEMEAALDELDDLPEEDGDPEDEFLSADIPVKHNRVNLRQLHPELYARLKAAFQDPRIASIARCSSGVRTYAQQVYLYKTKPRGFAANPDRKRKDGRRGSNHMAQRASYSYKGVFSPGEYGYAVDVGFWGKPQWKTLEIVMRENGLVRTVFRPYEPWHFELDPKWGGDRSASLTAKLFTVSEIQTFLGERNKDLPNTVSDPGGVDGRLGKNTTAAITSWQTLLEVDADGKWGKGTQAATDSWTQKRGKRFRKGSKGSVVTELQTYLAARHAEQPQEVPDPGKADGSFGSRTVGATKGWQSVLDVDADGIWGPGTWTASDKFDDKQRA